MRTAISKRRSTICAKRAWPRPPRSRAASPPRVSSARTSAQSATPARWSRSTARPTSSPTPPSSRKWCNAIAKQIVVSDPADVDALLAQPSWTAPRAPSAIWSPKRPPRSARRSPCAASCATPPPDGTVDSYIHMGGKVGVLVLAEGEVNDNCQGSSARCRPADRRRLPRSLPST